LVLWPVSVSSMNLDFFSLRTHLKQELGAVGRVQGYKKR
jgi:hypothetical protein